MFLLQERVKLVPELLSSDYEFLWQVPSLLKIDGLLESDENLCDNLSGVLSAIVHYSEENFSYEEISTNLKHLAKTNDMKYGPLMKQLRGALTGLEVGRQDGLAVYYTIVCTWY